MSIYEDMKAARVPIENHYSDLHVPATPEAREILRRHRENVSAAFFVSPVDGKVWIDIPFCYDPYWA